jgi:hypothetical protein
MEHRCRYNDTNVPSVPLFRRDLRWRAAWAVMMAIIK